MKLIAHRNETPGCPENSVESLHYSAQPGIFAVECDVRRTGDGRYVIYHDDTLERLAGDERAVAGLSLADMRASLARVDRAVLTLDELMERYRADAPILLHVKENHPRPDLLEKLARHREKLIYGIQTVEALQGVRAFADKSRILAFMPRMELYPQFIAGGAGIIRLWEQWLGEVTPDAVHEAGAAQVWIMCNTPEAGMNGTPQSLDRLLALHADGALISDVAMGLAWLKAHPQ